MTTLISPEAVIGADRPHQLGPLIFTTDEIDKVQSKEGVALIWGHADWSDIFQPSKRQKISFCFSLNPAKSIDGKTIVLPVRYRTDLKQERLIQQSKLLATFQPTGRNVADHRLARLWRLRRDTGEASRDCYHHNGKIELLASAKR